MSDGLSDARRHLRADRQDQDQDFSPLDLTFTLKGEEASRYPSMVVMRTERARQAERLGRLSLAHGSGLLTLSPRSITTLFPAGAGPRLDEDT